MKKRTRDYGTVVRKAAGCLIAALVLAAAYPAELFAAAPSAEVLDWGTPELLASETAAVETETRVRYSEIYDSEEELPEAPEVWTAPDGGQWRLKDSRLLTVPLTGRTRKLSGEVVYPEVTRLSEIPATAVMEVTDEESGKTLEAELPLSYTEYEKERWQQDLELTVTFHSYGADRYRFGETTVSHQAEEPPLAECLEELYAQTGLGEEDCRFEAFSWAGEAYIDAENVRCRDARVIGSRRVWDCRAVYKGEAALPDVIRYRREMTYESWAEAAVGEDADASAAVSPEDGEAAEDSPAPAPSFWESLLRHGLTVSVSLFLLLAAVFGFRLLRRLARKADRERGKN